MTGPAQGAWIGRVAVANRVVCIASLLAGALLVGGLAVQAWVPVAEPYGSYMFGTATALGPLPFAAGMLAGTVAAAIYLLGRMEGFWGTTAPLNLGFCGFVLAALSVPPSPFSPVVAGAFAGALGMALVLYRKAAPVRKWLVPPFLVPPLIGLTSPVGPWAGLAAGAFFIGTWVRTRVVRA